SLPRRPSPGRWSRTWSPWRRSPAWTWAPAFRWPPGWGLGPGAGWRGWRRGGPAGAFDGLLEGADALLEPGDLVPGGHAEDAELAFDLPLDQAGHDLAVLLGPAHQVLGDPADLGRLDLALLGEQGRDPLGLGSGQVAEARPRPDVLVSPALHPTTPKACPRQDCSSGPSHE